MYFVTAGFNPRWDCTLSFQLQVPELALVRFVVEDHDHTSKNDFVGQLTIPFNSLRTGACLWLSFCKVIFIRCACMLCHNYIFKPDLKVLGNLKTIFCTLLSRLIFCILHELPFRGNKADLSSSV